MNAHLRQSTIEDLQRLWVALPVRVPEGVQGDSPRERQFALIESYCRALSEFSPQVIRQTVDDLEAGRVEDASKDFCPKPPKLADIARGVQRRIDLANAEERRRSTPRLTDRRGEFSGEHRAEMSFKLGLLSRSMRGEREAAATLYNLIPGAKDAAERKANEQRAKARREGRELIATDIGIDTFANGCRRRAYEAGSTWLWAAQEVWGPAESRSAS